MRRLSPIVGLTALALAAGASAQTAHGPATGLAGSIPLDGVTVAVSKNPPTVVSTVPANGATVDPGVMVLTVKFDQHMDPDAWRYAKGASEYPDCLAKPRLLNDQQTFVLLCTIRASRSYSVRLNEAEQTVGFTNVGHRSAVPFELNFSTSKGRPVSTLPEALKAAGLKEDDGPVEGSDLAAR